MTMVVVVEEGEEEVGGGEDTEKKWKEEGGGGKRYWVRGRKQRVGREASHQTTSKTLFGSNVDTSTAPP